MARTHASGSWWLKRRREEKRERRKSRKTNVKQLQEHYIKEKVVKTIIFDINSLLVLEALTRYNHCNGGEVMKSSWQSTSCADRRTIRVPPRALCRHDIMIIFSNSWDFHIFIYLQTHNTRCDKLSPKKFKNLQRSSFDVEFSSYGAIDGMTGKSKDRALIGRLCLSYFTLYTMWLDLFHGA